MKGPILYFEDDDDLRSCTVKLLERGGYVVWPFSETHEALEAVKEGLRYRLALLDLTMPDTRGPRQDVDDLIRESKKRNPSVPIITASGWPDKVGEYKRKGVSEHFIKLGLRDCFDNLLALIEKHL